MGYYLLYETEYAADAVYIFCNGAVSVAAAGIDGSSNYPFAAINARQQIKTEKGSDSVFHS